MMLVVELVDDELDIEPIHRLLDLPDDVDLVGRLADAFDVVERRRVLARRDRRARRRAWPPSTASASSTTTGLCARDPAARRCGPRRSPTSIPAVAATDAAVVEALVVPRAARGDVALLARRAGASPAQVDKGAASAAILCSPVSVAQTRAAATDRVRMPQKTTFFTPKPLSGMVFRKLVRSG